MPRATEVQGLEQDMRGAVAKGKLQFVDHQAIAVPAQTLQGNGRARHIAAQALQLAPVARSASDRCIEREAVPAVLDDRRSFAVDIAHEARVVPAASAVVLNQSLAQRSFEYSRDNEYRRMGWGDMSRGDLW